jgi:hypothetical protein
MGPLSAEQAFIFKRGMTAASPEAAAATVNRRFGVRVQVREVNRPPRQLLIGLDAMEWTLVRDWAQQESCRLSADCSMKAFAWSWPAPPHSCRIRFGQRSTGANPGRLAKYFLRNMMRPGAISAC